MANEKMILVYWTEYYESWERLNKYFLTKKDAENCFEKNKGTQKYMQYVNKDFIKKNNKTNEIDIIENSNTFWPKILI